MIGVQHLGETSRTAAAVTFMAVAQLERP